MTTLAVSDASPTLIPGTNDWTEYSSRVARAAADMVLMNEMPFGRWPAWAPQPDESVLHRLWDLHDEGIQALDDLDTPHVLSSRPARIDDTSVNEAFVWSRDGGYVAVHTKQFFPDEEGFYEARWWKPGTRRFGIHPVGSLKVGFLICTDVQFLEWARYYGRNGADLIAVPRATPSGSLDRWKTVLAAAAITSGCYVASSNRIGKDASGLEFGGGSWIFNPDGEVIAETSIGEPLATAEIDPEISRRARGQYPCYVRVADALELPAILR